MIEEAFVACPCCGEEVALEIDTLGGREQRYVEDCSVCCRALEVSVRCRPGEVLEVLVSPS